MKGSIHVSSIGPIMTFQYWAVRFQEFSAVDLIKDLVYDGETHSGCLYSKTGFL